MKKAFQLMVLLFPLGILAQEKGINFEHGLTWQEVKAKAKAENKYIFMDCFTTWCGPCKRMSANVFPQEEVGSFFNEHFVNVQVQMDKTAGDNEAIKKWYDDARSIADEYAVAAYPSFLYFSSEGKLVHRVVGGAEAKQFIEKSADALDPAKQYYTVLNNFNAGSGKEPAEIRNLAVKARNNSDAKAASMYANAYLATQKDLLTKENIAFIYMFTTGSKDAGFDVLLRQGDKVDKVISKGAAAKRIKNIIIKEEIAPYVSTVKDAHVPDWNALQTAVDKKYPEYSGEVMSASKVNYFQAKKDWNGFFHEMALLMNRYGNNVSPADLNRYAWAVFDNCSDIKCISEALKWSRRSFKDKEIPSYINTYANILYKTGRKDEALVWAQKALALAKAAVKDQPLAMKLPAGINEAQLYTRYEETIDKMKSGDKTWNN